MAYTAAEKKSHNSQLFPLSQPNLVDLSFTLGFSEARGEFTVNLTVSPCKLQVGTLLINA